MFMTGMKPGEVYTSTDITDGRTPATGTVGTDSSGKSYVFVLVAASQNLVNGNVVTFGGSTAGAPFTATILSSAAPAPGNNTPLAVAVCSITASASTYIWAQVYGSGNVRVTDTTASNLPLHILTPSSTPGEVRGGLATASAYIDGLCLTATASTATLSACFINFPRLVAG